MIIIRLLFPMLALLLLVCDCQMTGGLPLSGGSVPIGDIDGAVYRASGSGSEPAANVTVDLLDDQANVMKSITTDEQGRFAFHNIEQTHLLIRARNEYTQADVSLDEEVMPSASVALMLAPPLQETIYGLLIDPVWASVTAGEGVQFTAQGITYRAGHFIAVPASWAVRGKIGVVDIDGRFTAAREGSGRVIAQYRDYRATATINVTTARE